LNPIGSNHNELKDKNNKNSQQRAFLLGKLVVPDLTPNGYEPLCSNQLVKDIFVVFGITAGHILWTVVFNNVSLTSYEVTEYLILSVYLTNVHFLSARWLNLK
jgi:hypothetical protein